MRVIGEIFLDTTARIAVACFLLYGIEAALTFTPLIDKPLYLAPDWPLFFTLCAIFGAPTFLHSKWTAR